MRASSLAVMGLRLRLARSEGRARIRSVRSFLPGAAGILCAGSLAACGSEAPRWTDLVAAAEQVTSSVEDGEHVLPGGRTVRLTTDGDGVRLEIVLVSGDWKKQDVPGFWLADVALPLPKDDRTNSAEFRLADAERAYTMAPYRFFEKGDGQERFAQLSFRMAKEGLVLRLPRGEQPAAETVLSYVVRSGESVGQVWGRHFSGRGFQVWPGQTLRLSADVPEGAVLRFATTFDPQDGERSEGGEPTVFRVLQDGAQVFEHAVADPTLPGHAWHAVALPRSGRSELAFAVQGAFASTSFLAPVLGPKEIGVPGERPWKEDRPDILVFLADTFRADGMSAYGGKLDLTPNLDRLAQESLLFRRAWSTGTFTLPSHATMFSGLLPMQAGVQDSTAAVPDELVTIAELLAAAGYRTGAVTASGFVSRRFGFTQGFAYFDEDRTNLEAAYAVERALPFLDADDGRPVFLFVHTYKTHKPYLVSAETRAALGERLGIHGDFADVEAKLLELTGRGARLPDDPAAAEATRAVVRESLAHYWGTVADLDRDFGAFHRQLEERGWFEHGWLVFTSDHGEAFAEHGEITHEGTVYEEKTRIPLFVKGMGTRPRAIDHAASLLDLTPTLADMAGLPARPEWSGQSLLALARDRAVFTYGLGPESTVGIVEGARKVIGYEKDRAVEAERLLGAFDLALDPCELRNVAGEEERWPEELLRRFKPELERTFLPLFDAHEAQLDAADRDELEKLGYGGLGE